MTDLRDQLQASLGAAYTIERELGGGGMSRVFVAEETSLARRVVVKVLPPGFVGSVSIARFQREISLAARLQHPHIVPLIAAGEIDGLPYYTMPFVDGESLRARLAHGELPIADVISILRDVARALAYAHGKHVAHRDIKPDNVLLAGTSAVITDFGVAKALSEAALGGELTATGIALGTPAYMPPEQAAADPATDLRADIYAFGVTAYEMLAGHAPFAGRSPQAMLAAHATETPHSIAELRSATPTDLANLVMRCLEKRPGDRPQSAGEILQALDTMTSSVSASAPQPARTGRSRTTLVAAGASVAVLVTLLVLGVWWRMRDTGSADGAIHSIAILPFENTSGDTAFAYLEDGISDHVRDAMNAIPQLTVKARSSSHQLKGHAAREVGAKLNVAVVLQGTVSGSNGRLHVTAELVRASDEQALWSNTFDGQPNELGSMQDTIVRAIVGKLRLSTADGRGRRRSASGARGTTDIEAYYSFLRGRYASDHLDFARAVDLFRDAIARDSRFARAHGYLAVSYASMPSTGARAFDSLHALARESADRALALDSTVAEAYFARALILSNDMRLGEALGAFESAVAIDSTNADILGTYGHHLGMVGRLKESLVYAQRARELDPLSSLAVGLLSVAHMLSGHPDQAIADVRTGLDMDPTNAILQQAGGYYFAFSGRPDSAVAAFETAFRLNPTRWGGRSNLVFGYAVAGRWNDAVRERALLEREPGGNSPNHHRMIAALAFGEYDAAMTWLERGVANREHQLAIVSIPCDPLFDPLKTDPRFAVLMQRLGARACPVSVKWPIPARGV